MAKHKAKSKTAPAAPPAESSDEQSPITETVETVETTEASEDIAETSEPAKPTRISGEELAGRLRQERRELRLKERVLIRCLQPF